MKAAAETTLAIAATPALGARIGITAVLQQWGRNCTDIIRTCT